VFGLCTLEVRDIQSEDSGVYTARACNTVGEVTSSAKLLVYGKNLLYRVVQKKSEPVFYSPLTDIQNYLSDAQSSK